MRILHLYSDRRWTGPAEPVVQLCLRLRALGLDVRFACRHTPEARCSTTTGAVLNSLAARAEQFGLVSLPDFHLNRYFNVFENFQDIRLLRRYLDREKIDIVHTHLTHDHFIGGLAARRALRRPRIIRTNHKGIALPFHFGNRLLIHRLTDGYLTFTRIGYERDKANYGLADSHVLHVEPLVDLDRFRCSICGSKARAQLSIPPNAVVAGIVARMQRHRRFDVLLRAMQEAVKEEPSLRLLVIGRGTHRRQVAVEPARELGLQNHVIFAGYRFADFVETLAAIDFKIFLVPGSDGTCRAVREAMAMGKPCIVARRGMLAELVTDGRTGLVIEDTPANLAQAILRLARDTALRKELGARAAEEARRRFDPQTQARQVANFYERILTVSK